MNGQSTKRPLIVCSLILFFQARNAEWVYLVGGSTDQRKPEKASTAMTRICLTRSFVWRVAPLPVATWRPAVATASNTIAVCGGTNNDVPLLNCQIYSGKTDKYATLLFYRAPSPPPPPVIPRA